jgi:hypothetical protein
VVINLQDGAAVRGAYDAMALAIRQSHGDGAFAGVTVQELVPRGEGLELIVGSSVDPQFGPMILFGSGGTLARSLVDRGRRLFKAGHPRFVVDVAAEWPDRTLSLRLYRNLQLIGYEALQNASRHADATEVTLRFHPWCLEILDDGRGLSAISAKAGTGAGLSSMRARAAATDATLVVEDRPGGGTVVRVSFVPR